LLSVVPAQTPGPNAAAGDTAAVVVEAVGGFMAAEVVSMAAGAEAFAAVTVEAASVVVTEVIEAVTVIGDMGAVTAAGVDGG
jgi:hypothetical protein